MWMFQNNPLQKNLYHQYMRLLYGMLILKKLKGGIKLKDGLILMYVKDNIVYPVALSGEQADEFDMLQLLIPQPIKIAFEHPQGKAIDLRELLTKKLGDNNAR